MTDDPARGRFFALQAIRLAGVLQVVLGLAVLTGKLEGPAIAGYLLLANGLADALLIPHLLAKRWKSPD
jgi:thiosulfate reductase cytochrome b subunit